jgi:hypothetical protein
MQCVGQLLERLRQQDTGFCTTIQMLALGSLGDPSGEQLKRADNNLQRLSQIVRRHGENGSVEIDGLQKIPRLGLALGRLDVFGITASGDAVTRRAKRNGHFSVYHRGLVSSLTRTPRIRPVSKRGRIEKQSRDRRLENDQFEADHPNLTIIKVSADPEDQDRG